MLQQVAILNIPEANDIVLSNGVGGVLFDLGNLAAQEVEAILYLTDMQVGNGM